MKNGSNATFYLNDEILRAFKIRCTQFGVSMSQKIESLMKNWVEEGKSGEVRPETPKLSL